MKAIYIKMLLYSIVTLLLIINSGCKKTKLKDEYAPLVGTWQWAYSSGGYTGSKIISNVNENYQLIFFKNGTYQIKHSLKKNNSNGRVVIKNDVLEFKQNVFNNSQLQVLFSKKEFSSSFQDTLILFDSKVNDEYSYVYIKV